MQKILKIIPYFGKLPQMWDLYVASLAKNDFLHLLFITDIPINKELPANIRVVKMTFDDFYAHVESVLGVKIEAKSPYKICELKPAMAYLFNEYVADYEYWAYGDIDIIYGDLKRFLKKPFAQNADVISFREDWLSGPFTVIKNTKELNELFIQSPDFINILQKEKYMGFDECGKKYYKLREGLTPEEAYKLNLKDDILCWTTLVHRLAENNKINLYTREYIKESLPWREIIEYNNGKIFIAGIIEHAIYHFISYKNNNNHFIPHFDEIPETYYISPTGVYSPKQLKWYKTNTFIRHLKGKFKGFKKRLISSYNFRFKNSSSSKL